MVTQLGQDVGKFKAPNLRRLEARPPYFHNGSQAAQAGVVNFYHERFNANFTQQEVADPVGFLQSL